MFEKSEICCVGLSNLRNKPRLMKFFLKFFFHYVKVKVHQNENKQEVKVISLKDCEWGDLKYQLHGPRVLLMINNNVKNKIFGWLFFHGSNSEWLSYRPAKLSFSSDLQMKSSLAILQLNHFTSYSLLFWWPLTQ